MVAFTAILSTNYSPGQDEKIPYDSIVTNIGGGYIVERNEFVCADPGAYVFYANMSPESDTSCVLYIAKNGVLVNWMYGNNAAPSTGSNMAVLELNQGDTVAVHKSSSSSCLLNGAQPYNAFSGFKLN